MIPRRSLLLLRSKATCCQQYLSSQRQQRWLSSTKSPAEATRITTTTTTTTKKKKKRSRLEALRERIQQEDADAADRAGGRGGQGKGSAPSAPSRFSVLHNVAGVAGLSVEHLPPDEAVAGVERATPVLFLRSPWCSAWAWRSTMERLSRRGFDCRAIAHNTAAPDPSADHSENERGDGSAAAAAAHPQAPQSPPVVGGVGTQLGTVQQEVHALAAVAQQGTPPILVAHGLGAFVAQKFLESYAAAGLVLVSPFPPLPQRPARRLLEALQKAREEQEQRGAWLLEATLSAGSGGAAGFGGGADSATADMVWPAELLAVESLAAAELAAERGQLLLALEPDPSPLLLDAMDYENVLNLEPAADFLDLLVVAPHNPEAESVEAAKEALEMKSIIYRNAR